MLGGSSAGKTYTTTRAGVANRADGGREWIAEKEGAARQRYAG